MGRDGGERAPARRRRACRGPCSCGRGGGRGRRAPAATRRGCLKETRAGKTNQMRPICIAARMPSHSAFASTAPRNSYHERACSQRARCEETPFTRARRGARTTGVPRRQPLRATCGRLGRGRGRPRCRWRTGLNKKHGDQRQTARARRLPRCRWRGRQRTGRSPSIHSSSIHSSSIHSSPKDGSKPSRRTSTRNSYSVRTQPFEGGADAAADDLEQEGLCDALADARLLAPLRREEAHLRGEKHRLAPSNKTTQAPPSPRERA